MNTPSTVKPSEAPLYVEANQIRADIKVIARRADALRRKAREATDPEVVANATLAYRHLEDASMRQGKVLQALDGGVSVYDPATTVGAPEPEALQPPTQS